MSDFLTDYLRRVALYSRRVKLLNLHESWIPQLRKVELEISINLNGQAWFNFENVA